MLSMRAAWTRGPVPVLGGFVALGVVLSAVFSCAPREEMPRREPPENTSEITQLEPAPEDGEGQATITPPDPVVAGLGSLQATLRAARP